VVWCGVVWCGVVWCGVVWCEMVLCGFVRRISSLNTISSPKYESFVCQLFFCCVCIFTNRTKRTQKNTDCQSFHTLGLKLYLSLKFFSQHHTTPHNTTPHFTPLTKHQTPNTTQTMSLTIEAFVEKESEGNTYFTSWREPTCIALRKNVKSVDELYALYDGKIAKFSSALRAWGIVPIAITKIRKAFKRRSKLRAVEETPNTRKTRKASDLKGGTGLLNTIQF